MADVLFSAVSAGENAYHFGMALFAFVVVIIATYFVSKWMAGYQKTRMTGRNFEVVDSLRIGTNKYIMLLRAGRDRYYCVGVGKDEMVMLGELDKDEVVLTGSNTGIVRGRSGMDFSGFLDAFRQNAGGQDGKKD